MTGPWFTMVLIKYILFALSLMNYMPSHSGENLLEKFLKTIEQIQDEIAEKMGVPLQPLNAHSNRKLDMTVMTFPILVCVLKTSSKYWINLMFLCDLYKTQRILEYAA